MSGHRWVKAPRSLFSTYICRECGAVSMVKHFGKCKQAKRKAGEKP